MLEIMLQLHGQISTVGSGNLVWDGQAPTVLGQIALDPTLGRHSCVNCEGLFFFSFLLQGLLGKHGGQRPHYENICQRFGELRGLISTCYQSIPSGMDEFEMQVGLLGGPDLAVIGLDSSC